MVQGHDYFPFRAGMLQIPDNPYQAQADFPLTTMLHEEEPLSKCFPMAGAQ